MAVLPVKSANRPRRRCQKNSPAAAVDAAGHEKPVKDEALPVPLVRPPKPLKPATVPNPEKVGGVAAAVREKPLKPLKAPPPSH